MTSSTVLFLIITPWGLTEPCFLSHIYKIKRHFNSFGAIGNYGRPSGRWQLSTLVDIYVMTSLRLQLSDVSVNHYRGNGTSIKSLKTQVELCCISKVFIFISYLVIYQFCLDIFVFVKIFSALT